MHNYTVRMGNEDEFKFESNTQTFDISDARFLYKSIRNPLKNRDIKHITEKYPDKNEYLHKKLDKRNFQKIDFFEKHKDDVVLKGENGEKLTVKDFWQPCITDVSVSFLNQLTLQISKNLIQKIPSCITPETSMTFHANRCIKYNGFCYSFVTISPLETPDGFLEIISLIVIKWRSKSSEFEYIETNQDVDEDLIEFMLCDYDEEEAFCKAYFKHDLGIQGCLDRLVDYISNNKNKQISGFAETDNYIDVYDLESLEDLYSYPDVVFKFTFGSKVNKSILEQTENTILKFINKYNSKNQHKIHDAFYVDKPKTNSKDSDNTLVFAVDFGNSNPSALLKLIAFLENSNLNISKIQIKTN